MHGVSTRSVDDLVKAMGMIGISKSQVSRLCGEIDERVHAFLNRPIEGEWPYLWIDATYVKVPECVSVELLAQFRTGSFFDADALSTPRRFTPKHLQAYLDEYAFRHNRRRTNGVGRIAARVIERLVARQPLTMRSLIDDTRPCRWFRQPELTA